MICGDSHGLSFHGSYCGQFLIAQTISFSPSFTLMQNSLFTAFQIKLVHLVGTGDLEITGGSHWAAHIISLAHPSSVISP